MNVVEIKLELDKPPPWLPEYSEFCYNVLDYMKIDNWEVSVVLCTDPFIKDLNKSYRGKDEPTDVLSFPQTDEWREGTISYAGDIVISIESVARNAKTFSADTHEELKRVYIHGVLHLQGMDHGSNDAEEPMLKLQEETLKATMGEVLF